jgi:hypothetical protein
MLKRWLNTITFPDVLIVIIIIVISGGCFFIIKNKGNSLSANIYYQGYLTGKYLLKDNQLIQINDKCVAEIRENHIRMAQSSCADKRCIKQGWSNANPIICLPNQVVIEVRSERQKQTVHLLY